MAPQVSRNKDGNYAESRRYALLRPYGLAGSGRGTAGGQPLRGQAADGLPEGHPGHQFRGSRPRGDLGRVFLRDLPQHPADGLSDEELLLRQHRSGVPLEPLGTRPACLIPGSRVRSAARRTQKSSSAAHPSIRGHASGRAARSRRRCPRPASRRGPGARVTDQRLDGARSPERKVPMTGGGSRLPPSGARRQARATAPPPTPRRPAVEAGIALGRSRRDRGARHGDADELQVALQVPPFLLGPIRGRRAGSNAATTRAVAVSAPVVAVHWLTVPARPYFDGAPQGSAATMCLADACRLTGRFRSCRGRTG